MWFYNCFGFGTLLLLGCPAKQAHEWSEELLSKIFSMSLILKGLAIQWVKPWTEHFSFVSAKASAVTATILQLVSPYFSFSSFTTSIPPPWHVQIHEDDIKGVRAAPH